MSNRQRRPRVTRRRVWLAVGLVVALWLAAVGVQGVRARDQLVDGRGLAEDAIDLDVAALLEGDAADLFRRAATELDGGADTLKGPAFAPVGLVPVAGRQLRVTRRLAGEASRLAVAAADLADTVAAHEDAPTGQGWLDAMAEIGAALGEVRLVVDDVDLGVEEGLIGALADARQELTEELSELRTTLVDAETALLGLQTLLAGPRDLLLMAANNAEMRAAHGTMLQWGVLHTEGGRLAIPTGMQPIRTFPRPAQPPPLDPALEAGWGWVDLANVANLGVSPRWDLTARRILDLYEAGTGTRPGGVLLVDAVALAGVIDVLGRPIPAADGAEIDPDDGLDYLLHDQYEGIPLDGLFRVNLQRRDSLADLAATVMTGLLQDAPVAPLVDLMAELGGRRHILAYSDEAPLQDGWRALGVSGELEPTDVAVSLVNAGQNKLDQHIETEVAVTTADAGEDVEVTLELTARNTTPEDELPYVLGFRPPGLPPEAYASLAVFTLPAYAGDPVIAGHSTYRVVTRDAVSTTLAVPLDLDRGQTGTLSATFRVPAESRLRFVPTAREPATTWTIDGERRKRGQGLITLDV